jgi:hypothetical protein
MASRQPIRIHDQVFRTKEALRIHIRGLIAHYPDGKSLSDVHIEFVMGLVKRHRLSERKIGEGVSTVIIKTVPPFGTRAFHLIRSNGTEVEVSRVECLNATPQWSRVQNACREAVHEQIEHFVRTSFRLADPIPCAITGQPVTRDACHVDHEPAFRELVERFLEETGIDYGGVAIGGDLDHETRDYFRTKVLIFAGVLLSISRIQALRKEPLMEAQAFGRPEGALIMNRTGPHCINMIG